jgi:hypothetical protein
VISINSTLGTLTTEINNVNTYALNLNSTKANIASGEFTGVPKAPTRNVLTSNTAIATTAFVHSVLPYGCILMWSGSIATIPAGYALCDGTNSTPDLRNRFVVGAGNTYSVTDIGGNKDAIVVTHGHAITISDPGHGHTVTDPGHAHLMVEVPTTTRVSDGVIDGSYHAGHADRTYTNRNTDSATTGITLSTASTGITASTASAGASGTNANLPPYYALCFIMKVV